MRKCTVDRGAKLYRGKAAAVTAMQSCSTSCYADKACLTSNAMTGKLTIAASAMIQRAQHACTHEPTSSTNEMLLSRISL